MPKKKPDENPSEGSGFYALAKAVEGLGEFPASYRMEEMSDHLASVASELGTLARVSALSVIAQHGSDEDRASAVKYLKQHYFEHGTFEDK